MHYHFYASTGDGESNRCLLFTDLDHRIEYVGHDHDAPFPAHLEHDVGPEPYCADKTTKSVYGLWQNTGELQVMEGLRPGR